MGNSGDCEFFPLRVTKVGVNGKRSYDREGKRMLIEACLEPGVSVASMAIRAQVNTNQLWRWIKAYKAEQQGDGVPGGELTAFAPVVEIRAPHAQAQQPQSTLPKLPAVDVPQPACLSARLPNGVMLELQCTSNDASLLAALVKALGGR